MKGSNNTIQMMSSSSLNEASTTGVFSQRQSSPMEYPAMAPTRSAKPAASLFRQVHQSGFLSILYAVGQKPLDIWEKQVRSGYIKRINDNEIRSLTIEIMSPNIGTTFITTPVNPAQSLGIRLPIIVLVLKNLKRYFMFEVQILDDTKNRRRIIVSNFTQGPKVRPFTANIPLRLDEGWNQVSLNLIDLTQKIYGTVYKETVRVQVHPNCRLRRVYFCDRTYTEDEVPTQFKLFIMNAAKSEEGQGSYDAKAGMVANSPDDSSLPPENPDD